MSDRTRVFNCDCLPAMKEFPDKHFDLAIVDPPYGIGEDGGAQRTRGSKKTNGTKKDWDDETPNEQYFLELERISKNRIIWGANYFGTKPSKSFIIWDKLDYGSDFADCEFAWCSFDSAARIYKQSRQSNQGRPECPRIHPTQKPVALYKWLLKNYAKEGDKIVDSHGGSMSSVIACLDMGFSITCYELDPDYYNAGKNRIINHLKQLNAFRPAYDIEFHDNSGVSQLRNNAGIGYQKQKDGANNNPVHRVDGLFHGDPPQSDIQTPKAS